MGSREWRKQRRDSDLERKGWRWGREGKRREGKAESSWGGEQWWQADHKFLLLHRNLLSRVWFHTLFQNWKFLSVWIFGSLLHVRTHRAQYCVFFQLSLSRPGAVPYSSCSTVTWPYLLPGSSFLMLRCEMVFLEPRLLGIVYVSTPIICSALSPADILVENVARGVEKSRSRLESKENSAGSISHSRRMWGTWQDDRFLAVLELLACLWCFPASAKWNRLKRWESESRCSHFSSESCSLS